MNTYIYIYIYRERERDKEGERESVCVCVRERKRQRQRDREEWGREMKLQAAIMEKIKKICCLFPYLYHIYIYIIYI